MEKFDIDEFNKIINIDGNDIYVNVKKSSTSIYVRFFRGNIPIPFESTNGYSYKEFYMCAMYFYIRYRKELLPYITIIYFVRPQNGTVFNDYCNFEKLRRMNGTELLKNWDIIEYDIYCTYL